MSAHDLALPGFARAAARRVRQLPLPFEQVRSGIPIWSRSYRLGEREHLIWRPLGQDEREVRRFKGALLAAAKKFDNDTKLKSGRRVGLLGLTGIRVLETMLDLTNRISGRLDPATARIAEEACVSVRTVFRALKALKEHGFIDWIRRTMRTGLEGAGPQDCQISSAYWFPLKKRAAGLYRLIRGAPPPAALDRDEVQAAAVAARSAGLSSMEHGRAPPPTLETLLPPDTAAAMRRRAEERSRASFARGATDSGAVNPGAQGKI
jgi:hypothetical protein